MTGALIVNDNTFVQALEGDEDVVRDLYVAIGRDERHERVTLLEETVAPRTFGRWAMARVSEDGSPDIRLVSSASKGVIVSAGTDGSVTADQESVLAEMRAAAAAATA